VTSPHADALPDRSTPPPPGPLRPFHLPEVLDARTAPDGLEVRLVPDGRVPLVTGVLVLATGEAGVEPGSEGLASLAAEALLGGTAHRSGAELAEALEQQGTSFSVRAGWDATTVTFTATAERLGDTLALLAEVVREPGYPQAEVERVRRERLAALAQRRADPSDLADDEADRVLYPPEHPFSRCLLGTEGSLALLGPAEAGAWAGAHLAPGGGGLVLAGDLGFDEAVSLVTKYLGDWRGSPPALPDLPPVTLPDARRIVVKDRPGAVQTELRLVHPGPPRSTDDHAALVVANSVLGGSFTSRLNLNLRERHGFTYGVRSGWTFRRRAGEFSVSTAVGTDVTVAGLRETMHELRRFMDEGPTQDEVDRARDYLAGVFPLRMETAAQRASRVAELVALGLPADTHHHYRDRIRAVSRDEAHRAMRAHLDVERAPVILCGDGAVLRPGLEALELGPVELR
jgi:zinc protease